MASHGYPSGLVFHQEQDMGRLSKLIRSGSPNLRLHQSEEPRKHLSCLSETNHFVRIDSSIRRHTNQFSRMASGEPSANMDTTSLDLEIVRVAPLKSAEKIKLKPPSQKKTNEKADAERYLHYKSFSDTCESLLSIMMEKKRDPKTAILLLKKSGSKLPQLLNQLSARIAGAGVACFLSVIIKLARGRGVAFWGFKTGFGFGFGLVWLSWAVSELRKTVIYISKSSSKLGSEEEEMMSKLDRSMNEVFVGAATLMTVALMELREYVIMMGICKNFEWGIWLLL